MPLFLLVVLYLWFVVRHCRSYVHNIASKGRMAGEQQIGKF